MPNDSAYPHPGPPVKVVIADSSLEGAGRGMFATAAIEAGELIESCPVINLPNPRDRARLRRTGLINYYFLWGSRRDLAAICLGYGSLYNHSYDPNARYEKRIDREQMDFYALRSIAAGEEITVNYNGAPDDMSGLWIDSVPPANVRGGSANKYKERRPIRRRVIIALLSATGGAALGFALHDLLF